MPLLAYNATATRTARTAARTPRGPAQHQLFLDWLIAEANADCQQGLAIDLSGAIRQFCYGTTAEGTPAQAGAEGADAHLPATPERKTPDASIASRLYCELKAGALDPQVEITTADAHKLLGERARASIQVWPATNADASRAARAPVVETPEPTGQDG